MPNIAELPRSFKNASSTRVDFFRLKEASARLDFFVVLCLIATAALIVINLIHAFPNFGLMAEILEQFP